MVHQGAADDPIPQPQGHEQFRAVRAQGQHLFRQLGNCDFPSVVGEGDESVVRFLRLRGGGGRLAGGIAAAGEKRCRQRQGAGKREKSFHDT